MRHASRESVCKRAVLLMLGIATLGGCAATASLRAHTLDGVAKVRIVKRSPVAIVERGRITGGFDGSLTLDISLVTGRMSFVASNRQGSFEGTAQVRAYQLSGPVRHFVEIGVAEEGTGAFAHIDSSHLTFKTVDDRVHHRIIVTLTGALGY